MNDCHLAVSPLTILILITKSATSKSAHKISAHRKIIYIGVETESELLAGDTSKRQSLTRTGEISPIRFNVYSADNLFLFLKTV